MKGPWLFSRELDLLAFGGSALLSVVLVMFGATAGLLDGDTPAWAWVLGVLLVDVAHVYGSWVRIYMDPVELSRRPFLYGITPLVAFVAGYLLHARDPLLFWRALAYLAVFHFVRQQAGWVLLYRARAGETGGRVVDLAAIYLATLFPLLSWHAHPGAFSWMMRGDFVTWDGFATLAEIAKFAWAGALLVYAARALWQWRHGRANPGKDLVVATTALCWWLGIVALDSDYAFTVTNVFIHGIPYLVLIYMVGRATGRPASVFSGFGPGKFVLAVWLFAFVEEFFWDHGAFHDHEWLFGGGLALDAFRPYLVPLLAVPQLTHYVLDGFIWKRRTNPDVARALGARS